MEHGQFYPEKKSEKQLTSNIQHLQQILTSHQTK